MDDSVRHQNVVDHLCRHVDVEDGDDNDADGYVNVEYRVVEVGYRDVNERYRDVFGTLGVVPETDGHVHVGYRDVGEEDGDGVMAMRRGEGKRRRTAALQDAGAGAGRTYRT